MEDAETASSKTLDINVAAFDCSSFVSEQLRTRSLPDLMSQQAQFVNEIRGLDRDMQDLVYNNYNKFISATDTIRRMKDSVGDMESAMQRLVTDMRAMGGSSALVNEHLQENRSKIEKLVGVKRLLLKLEFLFELPMRLRRSMELDALAQAVRYYTMVDEVLIKYDRIGSIHNIRIEADAIIDRLKIQLRNVLKSRKDGVGASTVSSAKVVEAIRLLVALREPRAGLRAAYLTFQRGRLISSLHGFASRFSPHSGSTSGAALPSTSVGTEMVAASEKLSDRAKVFYSQAQAAKTASVAAPTTIAPSRPRSTVGAYTYIQGVNRAFLDGFRYGVELYVELFEEKLVNSADSSTSAASDADSNELRAVREELISFTKDVFGEYFLVLKRQLSLPPTLTDVQESDATGNDGDKGKKSKKLQRADSVGSPIPGKDTDADEAEAEQMKAAAIAAAGYVSEKESDESGRYGQIKMGLNLLLQDVRGAAKHVREAQLIHRAQEVTDAILRAQLDGLFADVRGHVIRILVALQKKAASIYSEARDAQSSGVGVVAGAAKNDWVVTVGAALSAAAEEASNSISEHIDEALHEAKPLTLTGMRLLPDMARTFKSLVHGQVLSVLSWLGAAFEALGDGAHACRAEFNSIVVEADIGLDRELDASASKKKPATTSSSASRGTPQAANSSSTSSSKVSVQRRATVNFANAEADQNASVPPSATASSSILNPESDSHHSFLLLAAVLCKHFAHNGVARALSTMIAAEPSRTELQAMGVAINDEDQADSYGSMMDVPDLIKRVQASGRELLRRFAFLHSQRLSNVVRVSMTSSDWLAQREPREPRLVVQLIAEDVALQKKLVAATLGEYSASNAASLAISLGIGSIKASSSSASNPFGASSQSGGSGAASAVAAATAMARRTCFVVGAASANASPSGAIASVSTLGMGSALGMNSVLGGSSSRGLKGPSLSEAGFAFSGGSTSTLVLGAATYSSESVAKLILRVVLRSFIQWTRYCTFSKGGFQQIQVDAALLHATLPFFTSPSSIGAVNGPDAAYAGAGLIEELIQEVAFSASERCVEENSSLAASVITEISQTKLATLKY
jgi:hypothetical protein